MFGDGNPSRRSVLRASAAAVTGGAGITYMESGTAAIQPDPPVKKWGKSTSRKPPGYEIENFQSTAIGWHGASWNEQRNAWAHLFSAETCSSGYDHRNEVKTGTTEGHELEVYEGTMSNFGPQTGDQYVGIEPPLEEVNDYDHPDWIDEAAELAIGLMPSPVGFAYDSASLVKAFYSEFTDEQKPSTDTAFKTIWDYDVIQGDTGSHRFWTADTTQDCNHLEDYFDVDARVTGYLDSDTNLDFTFALKCDEQPSEGGYFSSTSTTQSSVVKTGAL